MPMSFQPPIPPRERILTLGIGGVGKSAKLLDIARKCRDVTFYVWDNDNSYERLLFTQYSDIAEREPVNVADSGLGYALGNVVIRNADPANWVDLLIWTDLVKKHCKPNKRNSSDDWMVIDSFTPTWQAVQSWFTEQIFGDDLADYFMTVRKEKEEFNSRAKESDKKKTLGAFEGFMDWSVINPQYGKLYSRLLNMPCHWYITAEQDKVSSDDGPEIEKLFGAYGVKPKGQKSLGHRPMTVLILTKTRRGQYKMTTVKDRGREEVEEAEMGDFTVDYLRNLAGWKMTKVEA